MESQKWTMELDFGLPAISNRKLRGFPLDDSLAWMFACHEAFPTIFSDCKHSVNVMFNFCRAAV